MKISTSIRRGLPGFASFCFPSVCTRILLSDDSSAVALIYPGDAGGSIPGFSTLKAGQYLTHMKPPLFDVEVTMTVRSTFHLTHTPSHTFNLQPI